MKKYIIFFLIIIINSAFCFRLFGTDKNVIKVKTGDQIFLEKHLDLIKGKIIGIITNHSAVLPNGKHLVDALNEIPDIKIKALFGPEHGIRGDAPDGLKINHETDSKTGIKVYSLYGKINKPNDEMLKDIDVLIYDIQDIGSRFYTFTSTLFLSMEAAAERNLTYIVLDRPNPITGSMVEGPMLEDSLKSFVGLHNIPVRHGMTVGELATMVNEEGWLKNKVKANLLVIKMESWERKLWYDETDLQWIKPSPNMMTIKTAAVYPGTCFFEGTNLSEGRGTMYPFEYFGAPFLRSEELAKNLNDFKLSGVKFEPIVFTPVNITKVTTDPKFDSIKCNGIFVNVTDRNIFEPVKTEVYILYTVKKMHNEFKFRSPSRSTGKYYIDLLSGTTIIRDMINDGISPEEIIKHKDFDTKTFQEIRKKYLLYQ